MRNIWLSMITALVFFVASAVAQTPSTQDQSQGTTGSSPASTAGAQGRSPEGTNSPSDMNSQSGTGQYGQQQSGQGQGTGSQSGSQATPGDAGYGNPGTNQGAKGEKKLKGCVMSEGGQYALQTKNGKNIPLTGQDVSAHSGHEVVVHGSWSASKSETASGSGMGKHAFNVDSIDHVSDTCTNGGGQGKTGSGSMQQPQ
ncbi:MAG: hypothetical protein JOZ80_17775 [Acidobacteriaceae bacterium]|nr:hypothetical protein [Acidobacteriaceae bacterium]